MQSSTEQLIFQLKALADPIRLRVIALCRHVECSVSELTQVLGQSQPRISQHLKQLCDADLLQRFRDGHFVYYRMPLRGDQATAHRRFLALMPADEPAFERDLEKLRQLRSAKSVASPAEHDDASIRHLHRALVELTVAAPLGALIDIGSGQGRILKLLGSRAQRAVGVDIDSDARQLARTELLLAGVENCSVRKGDMYDLPFADAEFDTVILDDVLGVANKPLVAIVEACRLLKPGGRMLLLGQADRGNIALLEEHFAQWCQATGLRLAPPRRIPLHEPRWLLAVATAADFESVAA
ncbi:MAG: metalloregulator ArsR/SmtB family transcription factor [Proteobacteria bacterium]|nr:metalloregulator ArsR/SmtB family transcription factor [Pseudomonadota bacterium]